MKQLFLLLAIASLPVLADAQNRNNGYNNNGGNGRNRNQGRGNSGYTNTVGETGSAFSLFSESGDRFYLIVNGVKQNAYPQTRIRIEQLPYVENDIQIIFDDNRTQAITKHIYFGDPIEGRRVNLTLKLIRDRAGYPYLVFHKMVSLENNYRCETGEYVMQYGYDQPRQVQPATPPPPPAPMAMDNQSFASAIQAIKGSAWDDTRLSTAQTIANTNYFTTDQVILICKCFSWDDSRLAFAKYAFKRTVDNNNYFKVNSVFDWDSNKQELNNYVNANR
ncbi:MAG: DUF4476 domain-containing protein [Chitinophagia bacterium]|nr:DUF4476 domain-containing protein [Chitinophagia bacterium]